MIRAVFYVELSDVGQVADENAMLIYQQAAANEATAHGYRLDEQPKVTGGGAEPWLLVWDVTPQS